MCQHRLTCDQAIFTSIRTPMGEGYRIVAASQGLRPDEKQAITRNSPSHEALCPRRDSAGAEHPGDRAAAFYPLNSGRYCVSRSCSAGAEHTGRGGQRVYTHVVVFDADQLQHCAYCAFDILRALESAGLSEPQLTTTGVIPELTVNVKAHSGERTVALPNDRVRCLRFALHAMFEETSIVVDLGNGWLDAAEALIAGIPGPLRCQVALSAGLRYSVGRSYRVQLLYDDKGAARARTAGQSVRFVDPTLIDQEAMPGSEWLRLVERHWRDGDIAGLARRTARPFRDSGPTGREHIGRLYNRIDSVTDFAPMETIELVRSSPSSPDDAVENEIHREFLSAARRRILSKIADFSWNALGGGWHALQEIWRSGATGTEFADPLIAEILDSGMRRDPLAAATAALDVAQEIPTTVDASTHERRLNALLESLAHWSKAVAPDDRSRLESLCARWRAVRPNGPALDRIEANLAPAPTS